jgi:hypothetical protein
MATGRDQWTTGPSFPISVPGRRLSRESQAGAESESETPRHPAVADPSHRRRDSALGARTVTQ